jgi:hypothetical protein
MKIRVTKAPTFTKAIIAAAVFTIGYLASTSNLPSCSDTVAVLNSGSGECIERQSLLHTGSGWLALICAAAAVALLVLKHKDSILGRLTPPAQQATSQAQAQAQAQAQQGSPPSPQPYQQPYQQAYQQPYQQSQPRTPAPVPSRASGFCATCGTRIIVGDRFCQGCGITVEPH